MVYASGWRTLSPPLTMVARACLALLAVLSTTNAQDGVRFTEETVAGGIDFTPADKTSSPSIADLNQDGFLDIVQCNHVREPVEVFYGSASGRFTRFTAFEERFDRHGTAIGDYNNDGLPDIILSVGITTLEQPRDPPMIEASSARVGGLRPINTNNIGLRPTRAQGPTSRAAVRMVDFDKDGDLDMYLVGRNFSATRPQHTVFINNGAGRFTLDTNTGAERGREFGFLFTDYNNDGFMDIFLLQNGIQLFRNNGRTAGGQSFTEVTNSVLPSRYGSVLIGGAAEIDYDNDGDFDIYISGGNRVKGPLVTGDDILLENTGNGRFIDVSTSARLPRGGAHVGITVGDFDNDGFMDVFLPRSTSGRRINDLILFNQGNKQFRSVSNHGANDPFPRDQTYPTGSQAFDYDKDGRIDVVVATRLNPLQGNLRLFRNTTPRRMNNWVIVQVPVSIMRGGRRKTLMDAKVIVTTPRGTYTRRVGSAGETRTQSFIDQVHFGLGQASFISRIRVVLNSGERLTVFNRQANSVVRIGGG